MQIDLTSLVSQAPDLLSSKIDDETVLLDIAAEKYYGMDPVASRIWELLAQPRTPADVCETLLQEFEVDRETCEADVLDYIRRLASTGLVTIHDR